MKLNKIIMTMFMAVTLLFSASSDDTVNVNFRDLDLKDFVEMVSKITKKNILVNGNLKGKINFVSTQPIKKSSLIPLANSILENKGFTLVDKGDFMQVVKSSEAAGTGLIVDNKISGNTLRTVLFKLKTSNAAVIRAKIKPLLHKNAKVVSFKNNNVLSITAYPRTLRSIKKIIDSVEGAGKKGSTVIRLRNSNARAVHINAVKMAAQLFPKTIPSEKVDVLKDESTNSIILVGKRENVNQMIRYVKQLDQKGDSVEQKMYVIQLKNSNVEDMEKILSKLVSQMNNMTSKVVKKGGKPATKAMVVGDAERNALIVLATGEQIKNIRQVIRRIDVEKPQVYIVAKIVEINTGLAESIGVRYGFSGGQITSRGLLTLSGSTGGSVLSFASDLLGFMQTSTTDGSTTTTSSGFKFEENIKELFALGATIDLLKENGAAHILSEPSVLCTNNQESEIYVGETRSILTSSAAGDSTTSVVRNNYSREDIGISLKVKPRLSSNNKVTLKVDAIIEDIIPGSSNSADRPTTTKRKVSTNAIVSNGETIILGGLIKSSTGESTSKVPILGDIPLLGKLFSSTTKGKTSVNVVIYITPYIVKRSTDLVKLKKALGELDGLQGKYNRLIRKKLDSRSTGSGRSSEYEDTSKQRNALEILGFRTHKKRTRMETPAYMEEPITQKPIKKIVPESTEKNTYVPDPAPVYTAPIKPNKNPAKHKLKRLERKKWSSKMSNKQTWVYKRQKQKRRALDILRAN